jgi:YVTN family beta-propeller protein
MIAKNKIAGRSGLMGAAVVTAMLALASSAVAQSGYAVQSKWKIGGEGGWDYLVADSAAHLLYVTHGPRVEVLDTQTGKPAGAITGLHGTHGVALDDTGKLGYISDGGGNAVVVFDRHSFQTVATIPAGTNPDGILFEPVTKTVWAFNGRSKNVTVIDTSSRKVIATVALPGKPEFPVADGLGNVFDNIEDKNQIVRLDAKDPKVTATWSVSPCESPSGLAIDLDTKRLFAVCDEKKMVVVDSKTGKVVATPAIGDGPDATAFDAKNKLVFSSNGEGTLTVIDAKGGSYKVVQTLKTMAGGRTMALDAATGKVYIVSAQMGPRPTATEANPRPRPAIVPDSFTVVVVVHE